MDQFVIVVVVVLLIYLFTKQKKGMQAPSTGITSGITKPEDGPVVDVSNQIVSKSTLTPASIISSLPTPGGGGNPVEPLTDVSTISTQQGNYTDNPDGTLTYHPLEPVDQSEIDLVKNTYANKGFNYLQISKATGFSYQKVSDIFLLINLEQTNRLRRQGISV